MDVKHYGQLSLIGPAKGKQTWVISNAQPHVCIRLKQLFPKIPKTATARFYFPCTDETCNDLAWFISRYPLKTSAANTTTLHLRAENYLLRQADTERIFAPDYQPQPIHLQPGYDARPYQLTAAALWMKCHRYLLADEMGLGKTLCAILGLIAGASKPALVVCQAHLPTQWRNELHRFAALKVHIIKTGKPYTLPPAAVYIISYSKLSKWVDVLSSPDMGVARSIIFDECQELRRYDSDKYRAARKISENAERVIGLSGTPIYNYGEEIFNVLDCIHPCCLGSAEDFYREWCSWNGKHFLVQDTKSLGTYLRDTFLMLRRTRVDVGRELPPVNKIVYTVDYDEKTAGDAMALAHTLAIRTLSGSFMERGQAARELDILVRQATGVAKAKNVAAFIKLLLDSGRPVLLAGWHREVYDIWREELAAYAPAFYTGSESPAAKDEAKRRFIAGETMVLIISLRSGIGLDGLQQVCNDVVCGELDWSPKVHEQLVTRIDRDGRDITETVNAYYLTADFGTDPVIIDVLGIKANQSHGIIDPLTAPADTYTNESHLQTLAKRFLTKNQQS